MIAGGRDAALLCGCNQGRHAREDRPAADGHGRPADREIYWDSVQFISDETGDHDIKPETDADWEKTQAAATSSASSARCCRPRLTPRAAATTGPLRQLAGRGRQARRAGGDREEPDKVFEVGGTMYNVCSACHQSIRRPPDPKPKRRRSG
jgi:hypothetical protein